MSLGERLRERVHGITRAVRNFGLPDEALQARLRDEPIGGDSHRSTAERPMAQNQCVVRKNPLWPIKK
ncbi:MAG: hypothetical protein A2857_03200 [Candidatus Levybacteria bacterium RIFCSPHIGHO2_01_FULL_36_15]|nr:MAG: hypothetical protein A2857_03200 [Candidatus Levybacteria bacterium RIFCSPHIGHO2_01_FULL_36_15]OGH38255.1 MAG: hypothetical protein A2905_03430 [Candidatus Levybacteria bacterium RIFCSPLOWO2_01_FULL_36_10]